MRWRAALLTTVLSAMMVALTLLGDGAVRSALGDTLHAPLGTGVTPPSGMVNWWPGDGNTDDIQGTSNGTLHGGATFGIGKVLGGFVFNGSGSNVTFGNTAGNFGTSDFTIDFWMQTGVTTPQFVLEKRPICNNASFWSIQTTNPASGGLQVQLDDGAGNFSQMFTSAALPVSDGQFHLVAMVRQGRNWSVYVDGGLAGTAGSGAVANVVNAVDLTAGTSVCAAVNGGQGYFSGVLDEIELFNRALTVSEIQAIYNAGSYGKTRPSGAPLALSVSAPTALSVSGGQYSPNPFDVRVTATNTSSVTMLNVKETVTLPSGLSLATGSAEQVIGDLAPGQQKDVTWHVWADGQRQQTILSYSVTAAGSNTGADITGQITLPGGGITLRTVTPVGAGNTMTITPTLRGGGYVGGVVPKLVKAGQGDIVGSATSVAADGTSLTTTFDLRGKATGLWDVVLTNPDGGRATLPGAFNIRETSTWTPVASPTTNRTQHGAAVGPDGRIYAVGGTATVSGGGFLNAVDAYDPRNDRWTSVAPLPTARVALAAAAANGRIYAIGGALNGFVPLNVVEAYDPGTDTWSAPSPMPTARIWLAATMGRDGLVYAMGGDNGLHVLLDVVEAYNPGTNRWSTVRPMQFARRGFAAATDLDGRIYAIGGTVNSSNPRLQPTSALVERYDPSTNQWTSVAPMLTARQQHAATLGLDGRIYVSGGYNDNGLGIFDTVEAYDPRTDVWEAVPSLATVRVDHAMVTGLDGRLYVIGGSKGADSLPYPVEAYGTTRSGLGLTVSGPTALTIAGGQYTPNPFSLIATVTNNGSTTAQNVQATVSLPPGLSLTTGGFQQPIGDLAAGQQKQVTWSVQAAGQSQQKTLNWSVTAAASNTGGETKGGQISVPGGVVTVRTVSPSRAANTGSVTFEIVGSGFLPGAQVEFGGLLGPVPAEVRPERIIVTLDLSHESPGRRSFRVINPDGGWGVAPADIEIVAGGEGLLELEIVGPQLARIGTSASVYIIAHNNGLVDLSQVLIGVFTQDTIAPGSGIISPNLTETQIGSSLQDPVLLFSNIIPNLAPGQTTMIPLPVPAPQNERECSLKEVFGRATRRCSDVRNDIKKVSEEIEQLVREIQQLQTQIDDPEGVCHGANPKPDICASLKRSLAEKRDTLIYKKKLLMLLNIELTNCKESLLTPAENIRYANLTDTHTEDAISRAVDDYDDLLNSRIGTGFLRLSSGESGGHVLDNVAPVIRQAVVFGGVPVAAASSEICGIRAFDPNEKSGASGVGTARHVGNRRTPVSYVVQFENKPTATASAQEVTITDQLDPSEVELSTFTLGPIAFGSRTITPPSGLSQWSTDVDLRPGNNLIVRVNAGVDMTTGLATWRFQSLDPATMLPTTEPLAGFLPPNVTSPQGEGSVLFTIKPKAGLATGTEIRNKARIVFDTNAPIDTPEWLNTIDASKPTSQVQPLAATQATPSFTVNWSGSDQGAGIGDYTIYVSEDGGPYTIWQANTTATSAVFSGQTGKTYRFYSVARDLVGNQEDAPAGPDATTQVLAPVNTTPTIPGKPTLAVGSSTPNKGTFSLSWTASTDAESNPVTYTLEHQEANGVAFSQVATGLTTNGYTFAAGAPEAEGSWTYRVRGSDGTLASDFSAVSDPVVVDKTAPTTQAAPSPQANAAGWYKADVTVALSATDAGSGVGTTEYRLDDGVWTLYSSPVLISAEGSHTLRFRSTDKAGSVEAEQSRPIRIDRTAPTLVCSVTPTIFWPPSHKLEPVKATVTVTDALSGAAGFTLVSVTSSEPTAPGAESDIQEFEIGTADTSGLLRSERLGGGAGRTYTLTYRGTDQAGNSATCSPTVTVPHDRGPDVNTRPGSGEIISTFTARAGCGPIDRIQFGDLGRSFDNARVTITTPGGPSGQTTGFTYTPPAGTTSVSFSIQRVTPTGGASVNPVLYYDSCGEWRTFVGGGASVFR